QPWLQEKLGLPHPAYYHVPLLYGGDGHRLSKRQRDMDLGALRAAGIPPEAVVGQLACWAGLLEAPEPVTARELIPLFSWEKVGQADILVPETVIDR
ncbi:MAG: tRNA glutamyl-Q(34) synthetase GluQRS, partial [Clostridiales bacterium]|nr:tRNA glutamyl-Q(34) synthetase GluQRS [Clostridiales bacterium]